jgi:hypothetical protein
MDLWNFIINLLLILQDMGILLLIQILILILKLIPILIQIFVLLLVDFIPK